MRGAHACKSEKCDLILRGRVHAHARACACVQSIQNNQIGCRGYGQTCESTRTASTHSDVRRLRHARSRSGRCGSRRRGEKVGDNGLQDVNASQVQRHVLCRLRWDTVGVGWARWLSGFGSNGRWRPRVRVGREGESIAVPGACVRACMHAVGVRAQEVWCCHSERSALISPWPATLARTKCQMWPRPT
jgi:hypothetical protein